VRKRKERRHLVSSNDLDASHLDMTAKQQGRSYREGWEWCS
jgi:hypothetical protein